MARLVLTHVEPRGSRLAAGLRDAGHEALLLAFSRLDAVPGAAEALAALDPAGFHRIIVVSPSAARFAARARPGAWPQACRLAAVGPGTAEALAEAGVVDAPGRVETPAGDRHDADALLELASFGAEGGGRQVLVLAGDVGRRDWAGVLVDRGFRVERIELYRRAAIAPSVRDWQQLADWAAQGGEPVFVVTTVDAADRLLAELGARGLGDWARRCVGLCPHERIAKRLAAAGWRDVRVPGAGRRLLAAAIESGLARREAGNNERRDANRQ